MFAVIGGTGLYQLPGLEVLSEEVVDTPFGLPSSPIVKAQWKNTEILFLARHGAGHKWLPSEVNYRANIFALKKAGATAVLSVSAVGSLKEHLKPGDLLAITQYLDFTRGPRRSSFFGEGVVGHIAGAYPVSLVLHKLLVDCGSSLKLQKRSVHSEGTYVCVEGPRLGTRAESLMFRSLGADVVGMTNVPECFLAREAQLAYASLGVVTDFDSWQEDAGLHVEVAKIFEYYSQALGDVVKIVYELATKNPEKAVDACSSRKALAQSLLTQDAMLDARAKNILDVLRI